MNSSDSISSYSFKIPDPFKNMPLSQQEREWISEALTKVRQQKNIQNLEVSLSQHFQKLQSFDPEKLVNAIIMVKANLSLENADQKVSHLFTMQLAQCIVQNGISWSNIDANIRKYGINRDTPEGQQVLIEIAKLAAQQNGGETSQYIQNYGINKDTPEGQLALIEIAKLAAQQDGRRTSYFIQEYGIRSVTPEGQQALIEIAKLAARQNGAGTSEFIEKYSINSNTPEGQKALIEIAKLAAQQNGGETSQYIQNYGINKDTPEGQLALIEIAKLAAQQDGRRTSYFIQEYGIRSVTPEGQQALIEIAKLAAQQNGGETSQYIQNYGINKDTPEGQLALIEIAKLAAQQDALGLSANIQNYGIDKFPDGQNALSDIFMLGVVKHFNDRFKITQQDLKWVQETLEKNKDLFIQKRFFEWLINTANSCSWNENLRELFKTGQKTLLEISKLNPWLRDALTKEFIQLDDRQKNASWEKFKKITEGIVHAQHTCLLLANFPPEGEKMYVAALTELIKPQNRDFRDGKNQKLLLETLLKIKNSTLEAEKKASLIDMLFKIPFKERLECFRLISDLLAFKGDAVLQKVHDDMSQIMGLTSSTSSAVSSEDKSVELEKEPELIPIRNLKSLLQGALEIVFKNQFDITVENFSEKYDKTIGSWRKKEALTTYASKLNELHPPEKGQAKVFFNTLLTDILNQTFQKNRYATDKNPHLAEINRQHPKVLEKWQQSLRLEPTEVNLKKTAEAIPVNELIVSNLKEALVQNHLGGEQQASLYPLLTECIGKWENGAECLKQLDTLLAPLSGRRLNVEEIAEKQSLLLQKGILELFKDQSEIEKKLVNLKSLINKEAAFYHDIQSSLNLQKKSFQSQPKTYQIIDTDEPNHILLMGTEIKSSCQSVYDNPSLNKCLLGYFLDGKHRLGLVCDDQGNILARSVFRLLIDAKGQPVLFQEKVYVADTEGEYKPLLMKLALKKAASLGIPLVVPKKDFPQDSDTPYPHTVKALDKPVPFEYVDAIHSDALVGSIISGPYDIPDAMHITHQ